MATSTFSTEELIHIGDILVGAALADGRFEQVEVGGILEIISGLTPGRRVPEPVQSHLRAFDPSRFDLRRACAGLRLDTPQRRRFLLGLVARIVEVDSIHDLDESAYIVRLAQCIGARPEEYQDLTVLLTDDDASKPPPVPSGG